MIKDPPKSGQDTVVGENVRVTGKLDTSSNISINGHVKGEISSEGVVVIGKAATIEGPVSASEIRVEGTINGNIAAKEQLELESSARVSGDVKTKTLTIKAGAVFNGKSVMANEQEEVKEEKKEIEPELEIE